MTDFSHLSIHETITCLKRKDFSVSELIDFHVSSMENGRELNAFITETADIAREKAILLPVHFLAVICAIVTKNDDV